MLFDTRTVAVESALLNLFVESAFIGAASLLRVFVNRTRITSRVDNLSIQRVLGRGRGAPRHREDDRGYDETERPRDHEDQPHGRQAKARALICDGPIHDRARDGDDSAEHHSRKTHFTPLSSSLTA